MQAAEALLATVPGTSLPVTGFEDEDDARRFGGRVQGYVQRDHDLPVRTQYNRHDETLYLTLDADEDEREDIAQHPEG